MRIISALLLAATAGLLAPTASANVDPGQAAPAFTLKDVNGKDISLAQFKGKTVVLEWNNPKCPFIVKHYVSGNMQDLQRSAGKDVVWLAINSTNPKSSDFMSAADLGKWLGEQKSQPTAYLLDPDGKVGQAYGAKTTPHMFVINAQGTVVYDGAIDDKRNARPEDAKTANNFVRAALTDVAAGRAVANATNQPYGCSVKY
ncbi:thioredoxin family protein [Piscinibacterium candidicorallinum]|jgi:peroxiredoxin|uniref:Thioredoxin family protein n=1 Tax=Piscinibacterium candidicorallinum TaxID=1793872 RepID=A0ABV7H5Y6_9BURK